VGQAAKLTIAGEQGARDWTHTVLHVARHEGFVAFLRLIMDGRSGRRRAKRKVADSLVEYITPRQ